MHGRSDDCEAPNRIRHRFSKNLQVTHHNLTPQPRLTRLGFVIPLLLAASVSAAEPNQPGVGNKLGETGYSGMVTTAKGKHVKEAEVLLIGSKGSLNAGNNMSIQRQEWRALNSMLSDPNGRFAFKPTIDAHSVIVVDDAGYAEVSVTSLNAAKG